MSINIKLLNQPIWLFDGRGGMKQVEQLDHVPHGQFAWIQLTPDDVDTFLSQQVDVPPMVQAILTMATMRLRVFNDDAHFITALRAVTVDIKAPLKVNYELMRFWLHERLVVTVQMQQSLVTKTIQEALDKGRGPKNPAELLEWMMFDLTEASARTIKAITDVLNRIEDNMVAGYKPPPQQVKRLNLLRQRLIVIKRYLKPQREVMSLLLTQKLTWMTKVQFLHLQAVVDSNVRLIDDIDMAYDQATVLADQLNSLSHDDTNNKIFILTLVAAIFMPLSFLTGLLGVNLGGIPGAKSPWGFLILCLIVVVLFAAQYIIFRRRKWF